MHACCRPRSPPQRNLVHVAEPALARWANLYAWQDAPLTTYLPEIRAGALSVRVLASNALLIVMNDEVPARLCNVGEFVTSRARSTSDPLEFAQLVLAEPENGVLLRGVLAAFPDAAAARVALAHRAFDAAEAPGEEGSTM